MRIAIAAALLALTVAPAAHAGAIIDRAAAALRDDPVYVDPAAKPTLSPAEERRVEAAIASRGDGPIYVAVLPATVRNEAGGDVGEALRLLGRAVDRPGVYAIAAGWQLRAGATSGTGLETGEAPDLATQAIEARRSDGLGTTLLDFVTRVGAARDDGKDGGGRGGIGWWPILLVGAAGFFVVRVLRRRRVRSDDLREVKEAAHDDLVALAGDVADLEDDVERDPAAKRDYLASLEQYGKASAAFDRARTPEQLEPVAKALEEGRYLMASAKARLEGREPPERRPPCFFDPRHGPSVRDVEWTPPGGSPRQVPACAACALRAEQGLEPESRQVLVGGRSVPYWSAPGYFGGYFGGFLPGLLVGEMLGGFGGWGSDAPVDTGGDWDQGGNGDFGGGDFDGGDFGGGDF